MDISALRERSTIDVFTVSELNGYIKRKFDSDSVLGSVSVKGEISNFVNHRSGHLYFSIKDAESQIRAVMFRTSAQRLKFEPYDGMRVVIHGSVTVYQRDGSYQIYANTMEPDGIGALHLAYEQLKEKLSAEGLFNAEYKKPLPLYAERIGVITSPTGAAVRDIINVLGRRFPLAKIYLYPSLVQGDGASENLIEALDYFEKSRLADVIIIGRGGGSIEDLWAFNSEALARKIFEAETPIISAVGHETDFTICDFVSDMRAPTPSAAAELAVPDVRELLLRTDSIYDRLRSSLVRLAERKRERLNAILEKDLFSHPECAFSEKKELLSELSERLYTSLNGQLSELGNSLFVISEKLSALNPLSVLKRGYLIAERDGKIIKNANDAKVGDKLDITLSDGVISAHVLGIKKTKGVGKNAE